MSDRFEPEPDTEEDAEAEDSVDSGPPELVRNPKREAEFDEEEDEFKDLRSGINLPGI
ncbi:hypothetical protein [Streptomyces sp. NPDC127108]|uniref:hypothetical protein n=1 Tax=Streptomyces sp. NPDC127108 TaxID=3345361 RepID=UPI0036382295